jgi:hypothetical protein
MTDSSRRMLDRNLTNVIYTANTGELNNVA